MAEGLVQDHGLEGLGRLVFVGFGYISRLPEVTSETVVDERAVDCSACPFASGCDSARYNIYQLHENSMSNSWLSLHADDTDERSYLRSMDAHAQRATNQTEALEGFEAAIAQCPGGTEQTVESTYVPFDYADETSRIRKFIMDVRDKDSATHRRTRFVCGNPQAEAARASNLNFVEPSVRVYYT